jgi:DMSO/TMAO reductase YedYZ heme-binding membrane subunit
MKAIFLLQKFLIAISLLILVVLPIASRFGSIGFGVMGALYQISFGAVFLVMIIRPLADIFNEQLWLRRLIILRKGFGILSASIIIGFMLSSVIAPGSPYLVSLLTAHYWSLKNYVLFAHLGDISGLILLLTSNTFSQKLLKQNWKRIQRLSYVYFYAGGIYEAAALGSDFAFYAMLIVTGFTISAWAIKIARRAPVEMEA